MVKTPKVSGKGPIHIFIVGLGIMGIRHLTREGEACIRASRKTFYVDPGFGIDEFLREACPEVRNLMDLYREGRNRLETYRAMASEVVSAALEQSPVCFATYGHPTVYVYPTTLILRAAAVLGLTVHVSPGISILDTAFIDLGVDPGHMGLQVYEATGLLAERRALQPDVPCLLLQVDAVESALYSRRVSKPARFRRLTKHLLKFYPQDHRVISLFSATHPALSPIRQGFRLAELPDEYSTGFRSGTLYIPPLLTRRRTRDARVMKIVNDRKYLHQVTANRRSSRAKTARA